MFSPGVMTNSVCGSLGLGNIMFGSGPFIHTLVGLSSWRLCPLTSDR